MTREEDEEIVLEDEVSAAEAVRAKGERLRRKLELALKERTMFNASPPVVEPDDLFLNTVGDESSEEITPSGMKTPFPEFMSSHAKKMNSTMFGLPSLGDSSVSEIEIAETADMNTREVLAGDLPSELLRFGKSEVGTDSSVEWEIELIEPSEGSEFDLELALSLPTFNAESDRALEPSGSIEEPVDDLPAVLAESRPGWSVGDIDLNGDLPGEAPRPPAFRVDPDGASLEHSPADSGVGGPGAYIHRKKGAFGNRSGSGLHKLSQSDVDELFTSSAPGLRPPTLRAVHETPGALGMSPLQMVADVAGVPEQALDEDLECSLMFSKGGEPVSSIAVDEGLVAALIQFAFDYATRGR